MTTIHHAANVEAIGDRHGLTVRVLGDITQRNSEEVCAAVEQEWESHGRPRQLTVDLHSVQRLDSSGVGALMEIQQKATKSNVHLTLSGLQEGPRRMLQRTGTSRLFEFKEGLLDTAAVLPESRSSHERVTAVLPRPKRRHRVLWALVWLCLLIVAMTAIGVSAYPTLQDYHAQLQQVPILRGFMGALDSRVQAMQQGFKERFGTLEARLNGHQTAERKLQQGVQAEMDRRTAELQGRLDAVESAQRSTDARVTDLQQQIDGTKEGPRQ